MPIGISARLCAVGCALLALASAGCKLSPQAKEEKYLKRGQAQLAKKDYERAQLEFRSASQATPKDAEPLYQLGLAYLGSGNRPAAAAAFRDATSLNPKHWGAQLKLAELMAASRNKQLEQQAAAELQAILAASPENLEASDTMAATEVELGKPEDAAKRLQETLQKVPAHLLASVALARIKLAQKDFAGAEDALRKAMDNAPQSAPAALALGQFYLMRRQPDKAEPVIRKVLQLEPKSSGGLAALGAIQINSNRLGEADATYKQLAAVPPKSNRPVHAIFLFQTGHIPDALREWEKLVRDDPDDRAVRTRLVSLYERLNKPGEAQALLATALKRNPRDTDALFQRSALFLKSGNVNEASQDLKQVLQFQPDSLPAHLSLASVYRAQGMQNLESDELNTVLRLQPNYLAARLGLVRNFIAANQAKSALDLLDKVPEKQKSDLRVVTNRIWALLQAGDTREARAVLDRALQAKRFPELVLQDAVLKMQQHDYEGARLDAEEALRADPGDVRAARIAAGAYAVQNQKHKALQRLTEIVASRPKSANLQNLLGEWYVDSGNFVEARKAFEAAKTLDPASLQADLALAEVDQRENRIDASRQRLNAIVQANPRNVSALLLLGAGERAAGDHTGALLRYRSVLAIESDNLFALTNLAYELALDNPDEALKYAQRAAELAPDDANVLDTLAWVYHRKRIYTSAIGYLTTAVAKQPTARLQFHLAMAYLKSGQRDLGQKWLATALQRDPNLLKSEPGW